jgi:hypothetical protein
MAQLSVQHTLWQSGQAWLASAGWFPAAPIPVAYNDEAVQRIIDHAQQPDLPLKNKDNP